MGGQQGVGDRRAVTAYPDPSFLSSLYRRQEFSVQALAYYKAMPEVLPVAVSLEFEFLQAIELQVFLHSQDWRRGYNRQEADTMIALWNSDLASGSVRVIPCDMDAVLRYAVSLARAHTATGGHRTLDIIHVATAAHLGAKEFLSFDQRQIALAKQIGIATPFG